MFGNVHLFNVISISMQSLNQSGMDKIVYSSCPKLLIVAGVGSLMNLCMDNECQPVLVLVRTK